MSSPANSLEDPGTNDLEESREEPSTFQDSYNDIDVDHLLNNFQLVGTHNTHPPPPPLSERSIINSKC